MLPARALHHGRERHHGDDPRSARRDRPAEVRIVAHDHLHHAVGRAHRFAVETHAERAGVALDVPVNPDVRLVGLDLRGRELCPGGDGEKADIGAHVDDAAAVRDLAPDLLEAVGVGEEDVDEVVRATPLVGEEKG